MTLAGASPEGPHRGFAPDELLVSRREARQCLLGFGGWIVGAVLLVIAALAQTWGLAVLACAVAVPAVLALMALSAEVAARLREEGRSTAERYALVTRVNQQWGRPKVLRRAITLLRS